MTVNRILRWHQTGRANYQAADGDGGHYTIDRWVEDGSKVWLINHVPAGWPDDQSTPPRRVEWRPGAKHILEMAKASCQRDLNERTK